MIRPADDLPAWGAPPARGATEKAMGRLVINIVGTGGCLNIGLPYNACLIQGRLLLEAPPDIMPSLLRSGLDYGRIDLVFISHLHGDHTFGLPFLIINLWMKSLMGKDSPSLTVLGPPGIAAHARALVEAAFTAEHPCLAWFEKRVSFQTVGEAFATVWEGLTLSSVALEHAVPSFGLALAAGAQPVFAYLSDTRWCPSVEKVLAGRPKVVLMDMNGGNPDLHTSLEEVREKGLPLIGGRTIIYGTHLFEPFPDESANLKCARPGETLLIEWP
jgi:hypothetical protein